MNGLGNVYAGRVSGFGVGSSAHSDHDQFIDFDTVNFAGATFTYTSANPSNTSGTLTVINGGNSASVLLVGNYSAGNFTSANDGGGHIRIKDPGAAPPSVDLGLLINYMAASFARQRRPRRRRGHRCAADCRHAAVGASPHPMTHELGRDTPILSPEV